MSWPGQPPSSQGPPNPGQIPQSQLYAPPPLAPIASIHPNVNLQRPLQPQPYYPYPLPRPEGERQPEQHDSKRMRISRACDGCRRKKIRCYTTAPGQPCKNCMSSKIDCTYNDNAKKRGPPKGYIEVLENRLKRMERILSGLADNDDDGKTKDKHDTLREFTPSENERQQPIASTSSSSSSNNNNNNDNNNGTKLSSLPERNEESSSSAAAKTEQSKKEERPQRVSGFSSLSSSTMTRYVGDMSPLPFLAQKINCEDARVSNHIGFKVRKFGQSLVLVKENDTENGDASVQLLQKLGMLKPDETINSMNEWILRVAGIDRATSDRLMKIYFAYIHPGLPILNKVLFLKQYRRELGDYPSPALLNAIYGAAARYIETCALFGDKALPDDKKIEPMKGWSENLFENLLLYVRGPYSPCIATIQALVIGQYHRASLDERFASNWMLNSAATRMAQDLGLHRSSASWDIPDSEKETRRRVWWSVYIMDKWSSAGTGRPQTIFDEDCDESYPSESATWEEVMDAPYDSTQDPESEVQPRFPSLDKELAKKAKGEKIPLYQPFVQLVKLSEILGRILQGLYTPRAKRHSAQHGSDAIVSYLDKSLSEWRSNLPPSLQISSTNVRRLDHRGHMPLLSMSGLMYLAYCTLLILLHRPFIENDQELHRNKLSSSSLTICTNAATRCIDIAEKMHYRDFLLVSWNFALYPIFTAALIHIYNAASSDSIVSDVAKTNLVRSMAVIRRITKLSPAAGNLYEVLKKLVAHRGISVEDLTDGEDTADSLKKPVRKRKQRSTQAKNRVEETNTSTGNAATRTSSLSPKVSDVRGGPQPETTSRRGTTASSTSDADRASASGGSTPTSVMNGDWLNGFYSGLEQQESAPATNLVNASAQDMSDPYSLQQFGLPMGSMFPSVEQLQTVAGPQPQQQQQQQQPQTVGSMLLRLQSTDDFLFGFPDVGLSMDGTQQPSYSPSQPVVASDTPMASSLQGTTAAALTSSAPSMYMQSNDMSQTQFRYRPDNPFWSVPSTLELDDWTAYLLPQQQQQQQQQQRTGSEPPRQQQQMSWNGWM